MIKVNEKYLIDVDNYNYTVYENKPSTYFDKSKNKEATNYPVVGYYSSLYKALLGVRDRMVRDELKNLEGSLEEALRVVNNITSDFQSVMERILAEQEGKA